MRLFNPIRRKRSTSDQALAEAIQNIFSYSPKNVAIYKLAFRHKSVAPCINNGFKHSNERLEYLGDAILGAVVADFLFKKFPFKEEGFLTEMRSRIVSRHNLNALSKKLGLDNLIQAHKDSGMPGSSIPGDAFEAFIGAVYIDKGYSFTKDLIIKQIIQTHLDIDQLMVSDTNFKSKVIEWAQKEKKDVAFKTVKTEENGKKGKSYSIELIIENHLAGRGEGFSIKKAEQHAARQAWEQLIQQDNPL
ncbi:MAG: ribonuclease III [Bacteroidales bacterium]